MQDNEKKPALRFKGFTDPWEQRKLGDAFERVVRKNTNNESRLPLTISAQDGLVDQITYFNNRVASRDVSNYYLVYNGEFAYNKSTSDGYPFGAVKRLDWYEKGVLSTLYIVFALKHPEKDDSDFMTVFYDTDRWHRGVAERAAEGARNHGLLNISADDFFDIDTTMPEDKAEQEKIGRLFAFFTVGGYGIQNVIHRHSSLSYNKLLLIIPYYAENHNPFRRTKSTKFGSWHFILISQHLRVIKNAGRDLPAQVALITVSVCTKPKRTQHPQPRQ